MKVALYARVSTDDKDQNPETQLFRLRNYCSARDLTIVAEYVDQKSGKTMNRPDLIKMIKAAKKGSFEAIVIMKIDRLNRNALDALLLLDDLAKSGVGLIITDEGIDTTTSYGRVIYGFIALIAELERSNISERTMRGLERAWAEGKKSGRPGATLSQYHIDKAKEILEKDPNISQRKLASQFQGIGRTALIEQLKEEGIL